MIYSIKTSENILDKCIILLATANIALFLQLSSVASDCLHSDLLNSSLLFLFTPKLQFPTQEPGTRIQTFSSKTTLRECQQDVLERHDFATEKIVDRFQCPKRSVESSLIYITS